MTPNHSLEDFIKNNPAGIILAGGPDSVNDEKEHLKLPDNFFEFFVEHRVPILGICYGVQLITKHFGGKVENRQYCSLWKL